MLFLWYENGLKKEVTWNYFFNNFKELWQALCLICNFKILLNMLWHNLPCKGEGKQHQNEVFQEFFFILWKKEWNLGAILAAATVNWLFRIQTDKQHDAGLFRDLFRRISWDKTCEFGLSFWHSHERALWLNAMPNYWKVDLGNHFRLQRLCLGRLLEHWWNLIGRWSN